MRQRETEWQDFVISFWWLVCGWLHMVCSSDCQGAECTLTSRTCAIPSWPLRPTDWGGDNTGWIRSRPQEALHTSAHPSFFPKRAGIWVARWWQRQGSVSLLAHPKPADPQQEKCQTEEVIVACSALALCWVMQAHGWAQVRRTTQLVCGSPSNNNRLFKPLSFGIACYLGKLTGPTFLSAPK